MPHPFTLRQARQNEAFLERLALSGNIRLAAREAGMAYSTAQDRRAKHAGFAQDWEAVLAAVHARLHLAGGKRGPEALAPADAGAGVRRKGKKGKKRDPRFRGDDGEGKGRVLRDAAELRSSSSPTGSAAPQDGRNRGKGGDRVLGDASELRSSSSPAGSAAPQDERKKGEDGREDLRTRGGEPVVVRTRSGKLQVRLAQPGKLTKTCEQAFLRALAATANVRLSAAAAGASEAAFYRRRRQNPAFAREMRLALAMGYERLEAASLAASLPESHADDRWRRSEPAPVPPMSADQALQLLFLHEKSVHQSWEQPHRKRRRGESDEVYRERLMAMWRAEKGREAEAAAVRRAARFEETGGWRFEEEAVPPPLPPLEQVTGWSKASGKPAYREGVALFGGWRIEEMKRKAKG